jgi:RNA polymerase sigma factor (sigma-70 family)
MTDGQLLESYVTRQDEVALAALVRRHGPMVLGVCRRVLRNAHDAEDAFQAAFLVRVRKAASLRQRERVGNWLYGVAHRTALNARAAIARKRLRERPMNGAPEPETPAGEGGSGLAGRRPETNPPRPPLEEWGARGHLLAFGENAGEWVPKRRGPRLET